MAVNQFQGYFMGLILESFFYGLFLLLFIISVFLKRDRKQDSPESIGSMHTFWTSLLILLITAHWMLNIWDCYNILMNTNGGTAIEQAFANWGHTKNLAQFCMYAIQVLIGEVVLIYRLYRVSGNVLYIIFPSITCPATVGCGIMLIHSVAEVTTSDPSLLNNIRTWGIASACMTFTENFYCAGLIAFHIWTENPKPGFRHVRPVFGIFIESAGLWLVFLLATFILFLANSYVYLSMLYLTSPILGISVSLIWVRVRLLPRRRNSMNGASSAIP